MPSLRSATAVAALLFATTLTGCGSGTSTTAGAPAPDKLADLTQVRDACMTETADSLKTFTNKLTADQFYELSADGKALRVITPVPRENAVTRSEALSATKCVFREAHAPQIVADRLGVPADGEQNAAWTGFTATWESDNELGYRARVMVTR
ncbi:hypothetical protein [Streptomyces sp. NBC_01304]|uniref:hypothetical protein n=1 Tax=Streptomyces sp. NBC_01304 TaxID=2903818 RepID=UPI002E11B3E6|nr:hypothetical protein OG430_23380 [Streptomyces sp. NBC_01304]